MLSSFSLAVAVVLIYIGSTSFLGFGFWVLFSFLSSLSLWWWCLRMGSDAFPLQHYYTSLVNFLCNYKDTPFWVSFAAKECSFSTLFFHPPFCFYPSTKLFPSCILYQIKEEDRPNLASTLQTTIFALKKKHTHFFKLVFLTRKIQSFALLRLELG